MPEYDYKQGKNRIETILDNYMEIVEKKFKKLKLNLEMFLLLHILIII
jgi:hypothetical protein